MTGNVTGPTPNTKLTEAWVQAVGRLAYVWGWPMVSMINRRAAVASVPEPGLRGGVLPNAPLNRVCMLTDYIPAGQRFIACTNQDVLYGIGFGDLAPQPVIVQLPDFGDRFWVSAAWDQRTDSFAQLGKQYGTKAGFYALVGPDWDGDLPDGIAGVFRSSTALVAFCPRVFVEDTPDDRAAVIELITQINIYPLDEFDGTAHPYDWEHLPSFPMPEIGADEIHWVEPDRFFDQLRDVLGMVPPLPGEEALYQQFTAILDAADSDPGLKRALLDVAAEAEREIITPLLRWEHNGPEAGNGWYSAKNNSAFGTDYITRTAIARSNMFENTPQESKYLFTDADSSGRQLDSGDGSYEVTFAAGQLPPVDGFWSLTLYNEHHFYYENEQGRYSIGTKNPGLEFGDDGSLTLYVGHRPPADAPESNWLPAPEAPFSLYIRAYWPKDPILDGTWLPPEVLRRG